MRIRILLFILLYNTYGYAQVLKGEKGTITFLSDAPLEVISGKSTQLRGVIDPNKQEFIFSVDMQSFKGFNSPLQTEHFHENYLETKHFPKATFQGKIIEKVDFQKEGKMTIRAKGWLEVHGIKQERIIKSEIEIKKGKVYISSQFSLLLADYQITIPKIVNQKIAEEITIKLSIELIQ